MISSIQSNNVQRFSAVNALRNNATLTKPQEAEVQVEEKTSVVAPKGLLDRVDVADIRKNAEFVGEFNITDEDIKYGLMYGRSVIAEFLC
ncbi:MAG: hypothetical protein NC408_03245 [Candidatus Gastranaerophilales bacterium]|nr:hypothetical protein [Candidatus Gastranaerophilales bacterium]MCM1073199.1 hypothetical protein [Bacteroides sp.]